MGLYADASLMAWFKEEYAQWGLQKLDMGKSCMRFKKNGALPLELLTELLRRITVEDWVQLYEKNLKR
jgi:aryl carrier-like protein